MNKYDLTVELETIRILANSKSPKMLEQIQEEWFTLLNCKQSIQVWKKDYNNFEYVNFCAFAREQNYGSLSTKLSTEEIYEYPMNNSEMNTCIKVLKRKYNQRRLDEKLKELQGIVYSVSPEEIELTLIKYIKDNELVEADITRKVTDGFTDINEGLLAIGGTGRPLFDDIVPLKRTIITMMAYPAHHKTNQGLDLLIRCIENNPGKKVVFLSKEMDFDEVQARVYGRCLKIPSKSILRRKYPDGKKIDAQELTDRMLSNHMDIVNNLIIKSPQEFKSNADIARILNTEEPVFWVLDYLQWYAQSTGDKAGEQNSNVMATAAFTKTIAQITDSLGLNLAQVRKPNDNRSTVFPRLSDIEWSGLTNQLSHSAAVCFWAWKHNSDVAHKDYYITNWLKVRNGECFAEASKVIPEWGEFIYPHPSGIGKTIQEKTQIINYYKM